VGSHLIVVADYFHGSDDTSVNSWAWQMLKPCNCKH